MLLTFQRPTRREAFLAAALLGWVAWGVSRAGSGFEQAESAWVCLLAGGLVVALAVRPPWRGLVQTGLLAVGIAAAAAVLLVGVTRFSWAELNWLARRHYGEQMRFVQEALAAWLGDVPDAAGPLRAFEQTANTVVAVVSRVLPGLVLLQSVAALALAWALYRAVSRDPVGEDLPRLRDFRFNDHLIWGIVLALVSLVTPGAGALRQVGGNLATFFGGLYVARGLGIVAALAAAAGVGGPLAGLIAGVFTVFLLPVALFGALALGVTDTWIDWRRLAAKRRL